MASICLAPGTTALCGAKLKRKPRPQLQTDPSHEDGPWTRVCSLEMGHRIHPGLFSSEKCFVPLPNYPLLMTLHPSKAPREALSLLGTITNGLLQNFFIIFYSSHLGLIQSNKSMQAPLPSLLLG